MYMFIPATEFEQDLFYSFQKRRPVNVTSKTHNILYQKLMQKNITLIIYNLKILAVFL